MAKFGVVYNPTDNVKLQNSQFFLPKGPDNFSLFSLPNAYKQTPKQNITNEDITVDLGQVLGVSEEGQQEAKSLHPHKTSQNTLTNDYTPYRT